MTTHLAEQMTAYRRSQNLTQEDLAELLGVTAATISRWESGHIAPDIAHIAAIEGILGIKRLNSTKEWCFRVNHSRGYDVLFDFKGHVFAASSAILVLLGRTQELGSGLNARELLPSTAAADADAEYRRYDCFSDLAKLFAAEIRLIQYIADLSLDHFSARIAADFWAIRTTEAKTYVLMTFLPIGPINDPDWRGAFRIRSYKTHPMPALPLR